MSYWVGIYCEEVCKEGLTNCNHCELMKFEKWMEEGNDYEQGD